MTRQTAYRSVAGARWGRSLLEPAVRPLSTLAPRHVADGPWPDQRGGDPRQPSPTRARSAATSRGVAVTPESGARSATRRALWTLGVVCFTLAGPLGGRSSADGESNGTGPPSVLSACGIGTLPNTDGPAALPLVEPDVALLDSAGWKTFGVGPRRDFSDVQAAYDRAIAEDQPVRIQVAAGYDAGSLVLRDRRGKRHWIHIEPESLRDFPGEGVRATRMNAPAMYKLRGRLRGATFAEAIWAETGAGYTRIIGADVSIPADRRHRVHSHLVRIRADVRGRDPQKLEETPTHVILDRCYIHIPADGTRFTAFLVGLYGRHLSLINSFVVGGGRGYEATKAVSSNYAPGPLLIQNNYLATDGINIFFGADVGAHRGWFPSDITVRRNHVHKSLGWHGDPNLSVKNGFEIKNARRVLVEGNVFENNWLNSQDGTMILLRAESPGGICEDVTFRYNRILNTPSVWDLVGMDGQDAMRSARRISIHDNVAVRIGDNATFEGRDTIVQLLTTAEAPIRDLLFVHNTHDSLGGAGAALLGMASTGGVNCVFRDNIFDHGRYGVKRDATVEGTESFDRIFGPGNYTWSHNVGGGFPARFYSNETNDYPSLADLQHEFEDAGHGDLRLIPQSKYRAGGSMPPYDGAMRGADTARVDCATRNVVGDTTGK